MTPIDHHRWSRFHRIVRVLPVHPLWNHIYNYRQIFVNVYFMKSVESNSINICLPRCCKRDLNSDLDCAKLACYNLTRCSLATVRYCPPKKQNFIHIETQSHIQNEFFNHTRLYRYTKYLFCLDSVMPIAWFEDLVIPHLLVPEPSKIRNGTPALNVKSN